MSAEQDRSKKVRGRRAKLTLSVEPKYVAMLRKAGARSGRSISELVTELALRLEQEAGGSNKGAEWLERNLVSWPARSIPSSSRGMIG